MTGRSPLVPASELPSPGDALLATMTAGQGTMAGNLAHAIESGAVIAHDDGRLELSEARSGRRAPARLDGFLRSVATRTHLPCAFLNRFLFQQVYAHSVVPYGCRTCFKVKVATPTLRALMAMRDIAETIPHPSKSGPEVDNPTTPHRYATYFYLDGLDQARAVYTLLRERIDASPGLEAGLEMFIKRGCTNYELNCGPSDQYQFDPALELVEAELARRFVPPELPHDERMRNAARLVDIIRVAFRIGDETYRDFTGGATLGKSTVRYAPEG